MSRSLNLGVGSPQGLEEVLVQTVERHRLLRLDAHAVGQPARRRPLIGWRAMGAVGHDALRAGGCDQESKGSNAAQGGTTAPLN